MYRPTPHFLGALAAIFVFGLLFACAAHAVPVTVSWTNPTTRTDASALPASDLRGTRVERGSCSAPNTFGTVAGEVLAPAGATSVVFDLAPGVHCVRAFARAVSFTVPFVESASSNVASRTLDPAPPNPPTGLTTQSSQAFDMTSGGSLGRVVGIVPLGTPCQSLEVVKRRLPYYSIDPAAVTFSRTPRPGPIVAVCGLNVRIDA